MAESFLTIVEGLKKVRDILGSITSFEDIERLLLFSKWLNPPQVRSSEIECFSLPYNEIMKDPLDFMSLMNHK